MEAADVHPFFDIDARTNARSSNSFDDRARICDLSTHIKVLGSPQRDVDVGSCSEFKLITSNTLAFHRHYFNIFKVFRPYFAFFSYAQTFKRADSAA